MGNLYLERYAWQNPIFEDYIPSTNLGHIIVIPAFKETNILQALASLNACHRPEKDVLVIVLINQSEAANDEIAQINTQCFQDIQNFKCHFDFLVHSIKLPNKKAGVGLARKIGMDEAVRIFNKVDHDGTIICYDADCTCEPNYLLEIEKEFSNPSTNAGIVFYEHRLDGSNREEILDYELYLRYYIDALRFAGFPFAHQTLGSCILVRSSIYQKQGGMNTRKAGEDFYFLNKVIPLGGFQEINSTSIYPSDRISDRVPFGTGKAVSELKKSNDYLVYAPESFEELKRFFSLLPSFWDEDYSNIPISVEAFLENDPVAQISNVKKQTGSWETFQNRFFQWFDAFKVLKYIHFVRDNHHQNIPLKDALSWLDNNCCSLPLNENKQEWLEALRDFDRKFKSDQKDS